MSLSVFRNLSALNPHEVPSSIMETLNRAVAGATHELARARAAYTQKDYSGALRRSIRVVDFARGLMPIDPEMAENMAEEAAKIARRAQASEARMAGFGDHTTDQLAPVSKFYNASVEAAARGRHQEAIQNLTRAKIEAERISYPDQMFDEEISKIINDPSQARLDAAKTIVRGMMYRQLTKSHGPYKAYEIMKSVREDDIEDDARRFIRSQMSGMSGVLSSEDVYFFSLRKADEALEKSKLMTAAKSLTAASAKAFMDFVKAKSAPARKSALFKFKVASGLLKSIILDPSGTRFEATKNAIEKGQNTDSLFWKSAEERMEVGMPMKVAQSIFDEEDLRRLTQEAVRPRITKEEAERRLNEWYPRNP